MKYNTIVLGCKAMLTACSSATGDAPKLEFGKATAEKTIRIENSETSPKIDISIDIPYAKGDDSRAKLINNTIEDYIFMMQGLTMQQAVDSFVNKRGKDYIADFADFYKQDKEEGQRSGWYECHYDLKAHTEQKADTIVNYIFELDTYDGGAHGLMTKGVINFSVNTGKQVTLDDVLLPGYEHRLTELLLDKLMKQTGAKNIDELKEKGYLYSMDMCPSQSYIINDEGITFIYNQYEIAPYAMGMTELQMDWKELNDVAPNHN